MSDEIDIKHINMDDLQQKQKVVRMVGTLKGYWRLAFKRSRPARSLSQNRYYFGVVVKALVDWMHDENGEKVEQLEAHDWLARRFLGACVAVDHCAGKIQIEKRHSTHTLTTVQFSEYIEQCRDFLADYCGIITEDPNPAWREECAA